MPVRTDTSTRFKDELGIIPPVVYFLALVALLCVPVLMVTVAGSGMGHPPVAVLALGGILAGAAMACYLLLVGYVYKDAGRRGMSRLPWTLVAIFIPNGLGIVLYFILRKPRVSLCPQCGDEVEPGFGFCPTCGYALNPQCPQCHRGVSAGGKFCPYCGAGVEVGKV